MKSSSITFDESRWPILIVTHPTETVDKEKTLEYLSKLESYFYRKERICIIFDVSGSRPPSAEHRFLVASWIKSNKDKIQPGFLGTAYVMPNIIQRLVLTTFLKFMDTTEIIEPVEVFSTMEKALQWAESRVKTIS
jgi:hypothetical protein